MKSLYRVYKMRAKTDLTLADEEGNEKVIKEGTLFEVYEKLNFQFTLCFTIIEGEDYDIYIDEEVMEVINIEYTNKFNWSLISDYTRPDFLVEVNEVLTLNKIKF